MKTVKLTQRPALSSSAQSASKAILVLSPYKEILYCTKPAVSLIRQYFNNTVKNGYCFDCKQPDALHKFICKLIKSSRESEKLFAAHSFSSGTNGKILGFKAYSLKKTGDYPPLIFIELAEEDGDDILHSKNVEQIIGNLHKLGDLIWTHDFVKDETWFSGEVNPFTGYRNKDLTAAQRAKLWWIATAKEYKCLLEESDRRYKKGLQKEHTLEYPITDRYGKTRWVLDKGMVLKQNARGIPHLIIGTHTDITNLKKLQAEIDDLRNQQEREQVSTLVTTIETDRKRFIEFLQEDLNQFLSAASVKLGSNSHTDVPAEKLIPEVQGILQKAIGEINTICRMYDPTGLELLGLGEVIGDVCNFISEKYGKTIHLTYTDHSNAVKHLDEELTVLRTAQRLAFLFGSSVAARKAMIKITHTASDIKMSIRFKDPGFDTERFLTSNETRTLQGRYKLYGGQLNISKTASQMVTLNAWVKTG